ncbi:TIGR02281 family clan AA aspartic protease [Rhizobium sp. L1K21]|uniref:retropepsin-like aspartic protease family protein n=1 Tax=Rhizobium sp. L1K21 TaxID=2954933 RepID=UPI002091E8C2|nr:TIGR02281 family clan AA aspartic protease [Rhizobium sp. L1K21]MCO6186246.1 TIGR02281 family clan AA aspartic protease [Rhizobium sp. L1K21]
MNPLVLVLGILGGGLLLLIINHNGGQTFGMSNDDFADVVYLVPIAAIIGAGILASRERLGQNIKYLGIWTLIALVLVTAYLYRNDARDAGMRLAAELLPGNPFVLTTVDGRQEVVIRKRRDGHFMLVADIDNQPVTMLVDTGASQIALSYDDAKRIGLNPDQRTFDQHILTANGPALAAKATVPQIAIGPIVRKDVAVNIVPEGALHQSLLGMNFLSSLSSIRMEPDEMRLTD